MKKIVKTLLVTATLCIGVAGIAACGGKDNPPPPKPEPTGTFQVLSDLEFYNWQDAKDLVIGYENADVSDVKIDGSSLNASDYKAENGKLVISRDKLDSYAEGTYELKI